METTFMTIHNLSPEATILFCSESVTDVLGFEPHEVLGRSCFDYFHPDEVPVAKYQHARGIELDRAAILRYARIKGRNGDWVGCECVFSVVYDVLVACTSIYRLGMERSQRVTFDAPYVRRIFASSPLDPRYHMLQHLSPKFQNAPAMQREPRAALVLNRFTRTLAVMFATDSIAAILGVAPDQLVNKSFYECIDEGCLAATMRCLESAKANDSIAYLRFWARDPRRPEDIVGDRSASSSHSSEEGGVRLDYDSAQGSPSSEGGVQLPGAQGFQRQRHELAGSSDSESAQGSPSSEEGGVQLPGAQGFQRQRHELAFSSDSDGAQGSLSESNGGARLAAFEARSRSTTSSVAAAPEHFQRLSAVELEAVVSCTSDGLVVILRRARPMIPSTAQTIAEMQQGRGVFVAPWGAYPAQVPPVGVAPAGPSIDNVMNSIREVAVFAWSLVGINGNIATHGQGNPIGEAIPPQGLPIWDPRAATTNDLSRPPHNQAKEMWRPWSGRFGLPPLPQPIEAPPNRLFDGRDYRNGIRFDDLAPSAREARVNMWQARQADQVFHLPPPTFVPFPTMQLSDVDTDARDTSSSDEHMGF